MLPNYNRIPFLFFSTPISNSVPHRLSNMKMNTNLEITFQHWAIQGRFIASSNENLQNRKIVPRDQYILHQLLWNAFIWICIHCIHYIDHKISINCDIPILGLRLAINKKKIYSKRNVNLQTISGNSINVSNLIF